MTRTDPAKGSSDELLERLYTTAQHHAQQMFTQAQSPWTTLDSIDVATRAGSVVELLAKALLVFHDERLISKGEDTHHHLLEAIRTTVSGRGKRRQRATIDASVAVALASRLDTEVGRCGVGAGRVCQARNAAVHLAVSPPPSSLVGVVTDAIVFANAVVAALGRGTAAFWGALNSDANVWVARHAEDVAVEARRLVQSARDAYERQRDAVPPDVWPTVLDALQKRPASTGADLDAPVECPACGHEATVEWMAEVDAESDHGEVVYYSAFVLDRLACPVCSLVLDSEHLSAVDVEIPDVHDVASDAYADAAEYAGYYESDDDPDEE